MGNFDGVHLGHKVLLNQVHQTAMQAQIPSIALLFEPQPLEYFNKTISPARLTSFREKYLEIEQIGIDYLVCIPFNHYVANLTADYFVKEWVVNRLNAKFLIIGDDFRFGMNRQGTPALLHAYASSGHFQLDVIPPYKASMGRVSSTAIRQALSTANFALAEQLLGRPYTISGKVVHGKALGRKLGFPTANIPLRRYKAALNGVYLVEVNDKKTRKLYRGIANIGYRPTVNGKKALLEVHIFNFNEAIYGHCLQVRFLEKVRDEKKFSSLDRLKSQITQDVCIAQKISAKF